MTTASYPGGQITFTTKLDDIDDVDDDHINQLQSEVVALEQYVGTNPHGSLNSLTARLAVNMSTNGGVYVTDANPGSPVTGQAIFRNDTGAWQIWDGSAWVAPQNLSNAIMAWHSELSGKLVMTSVYASNKDATGELMWISAGNLANATYGEVLGTQYKFLKFGGVNTLRFIGRVQQDGTGDFDCSMRYTVGAQTGTAIAVNPRTSALFTTLGSVDVSGLDEGSLYDCKVEVAQHKGSNARVQFLDFMAWGE